MRNLLATIAAPMAHSLRMLANLVILKLIAVMLGPVGMGILGNFMSLITMVSVFSGGGIATGITKYVAEYKSRPRRLIGFLGSAFAYGLLFSAVLLLAFLLFSRQISLLLFGDDVYSWLVLTIGVAQLACFFGTAVLSVANGLNRQDVFAIITLIGYVFAIPVAYALIYFFELTGAAVALVVVASAVALPSIYFFVRSRLTASVRLQLDRGDVHRLSRYSLMALVSASVFPLVEIYIRSLLIEVRGLEEAGIWQGMTRLSGAYLGLFTLYLSTTYMPLLSSLSRRDGVSRVVEATLFRVSVVFFVFAVTIYFLREFIVTVIYSSEFIGVTKLVFWYLLGDLFRLSAYVIGFLGVAKAALRLYVFCELAQGLLLSGFSYLVLAEGGTVIALAQAYAFAYCLYFGLMLFAFMLYRKGLYDFSR